MMRVRCAVAAIALMVLCTSCIEDGRSTGRGAAPWDEFAFRSVTSSRGRLFNLILSTPAISAAETEVRLLFELQPDNVNYYYVAVTAGQLTLGKVECGVELPIAERVGPAGTAFFAKERRVTVVRRPGRISVAIDGRKCLDANDDTFDRGAVAVGARGLGATPAPEVAVVRASEIYASDDFMRAKDEATVWRALSGKWAVESVTNPGLSANAFVYSGRAAGSRPAVAILGDSWWDDYSFEVSAKPVAGARVGLLFRYVDEADHYAFRQASGAAGESLQLVRVAAGKETILDETSGGLRPAQWARLRVGAFGARLAAYVDDREVLTAEDPSFAFGMIGLRVATEAGADFDDVFVRGQRGIIEDFRTGTVTWQKRAGEWTVRRVTPTSGPSLRAIGPPADSARPNAKLIAGDDSWADSRLSVRVSPTSRGKLGLVSRYHGEADHDLFLYDTNAGEYSLVSVRDGEQSVAASVAAEPMTSPRTLVVRLVDGVTICEADGAMVLSYFSPELASGKVGLFVAKESAAVFSRLAVTFPEPPRPVLTKLETFGAEKTMANWAAAASDWREVRTDCWGRKADVAWHRGGFPGGGSMQAGVAFDATKGGEVHLFICCDVLAEGRARQLKAGYQMTIRSAARGAVGGTVALLRNGEEVAAEKLSELGSSSRIILKNVADYVLAEVDGEIVLAFKDKEPLDGWQVGYAVDEATTVEPEDVDVFCPNTASYSFVRAAADWRTAGGKWLVMNRWRCDPRWSFFGGESKKGVAAIWHKSELRGDLNIEFAAGIRHKAVRGGYGKFASDMNLTICGDGRSLASGYGFVMGGWSNTKTAITRNGRVVAEAKLKIPGGIHRRWFYFKITKRKGHLKYYIDHKLVLEYVDPRPLPDGQAALWTWQNGLMVARVRMAAEQFGLKENFNAPVPIVSKCMYGE